MEPLYPRTASDLSSMMQVLQKQPLLAVDCEGVDLGNTGRLCLMQLFAPSPATVYLIDTIALPLSSLVECGLVRLLENRHVKKLFFDARGDTGALYNQYHINVQGIWDLQVAETYCRSQRFGRAEFVYGLTKTLDTYLPQASSKHSKRIKEEGTALLKQTNYRAWEVRPLPPLLLEYAANDVEFLVPLSDWLVGHQPTQISGDLLEKLSSARCDRVRYDMHYDFSNRDLATRVTFL